MSLVEHAPDLAARTAFAASLTFAVMIAVALPAPAASPKHSAGPPLCQVNNITVEMPREFLPLRVAGNSYVARENSAGVLTLRNGFPQPIQEFAAVVEYLDAKGKQTFSMAFAATANPLISPMWFSDKLPSQTSIMQWKTAVAAGATFSIGATSGLTSAVCPAQARATLLHVAFQNDKNLDWSAPDWQLPVQPEEIPGNLNIDAPPPASLPEKFLVRVHVPAPLGPVIPSAQIQLLNGKPSPFFNEIRDQMIDWRYWFELRDGKNVDGDVLLLIRVHSPSERPGDNIFPVTAADAPQTLGIVDVVPQKTPGQWAVFYGGANLVNNSPAQTRR